MNAALSQVKTEALQILASHFYRLIAIPVINHKHQSTQ